MMVAKIELNRLPEFERIVFLPASKYISMIQEFIAQQYEAALLQLKNEINSYTHKDTLWMIHGEIKNSGGTLALHLIGNLKHFIGAQLGNTGFIRNRDAEFADRNISGSKIIKEIDELAYSVKVTIGGLSDAQLFGPYPLKDDTRGATTIERLFYLIAHFNYHVGQINYHRRLTEPPVSLADGVIIIEGKNNPYRP